MTWLMFLHNLSAINVPACNDPNASNDSCVNIPKVEANSGQVTQMLQLAFGIIGVNVLSIQIDHLSFVGFGNLGLGIFIRRIAVTSRPFLHLMN